MVSHDSIAITKLTTREKIEELSTSCDKCGHCCSYDSGFFLPEDIVRIASKMGIPKDEFIKEFLVPCKVYNKDIYKAKTKDGKKPYGECTFLDKEEGCVIHEFKPLHCKLTRGCGEHGEQLSSWFTLNYLLDPNDSQAIREWAITLQTHRTIPGGELLELVPDKEKLSKILNHELLK